MGIALPLLIVFLTSLFIWRAVAGFEIASKYIGRNLSDGVRGGTINAICSSAPEFFTTLIALFVLADEDGFSVGIGTTTGSAIFNGMIIPALSILAVVGAVVGGRAITGVSVARRALVRDGLWLIACEAVLVLFLSGNRLHWWHGLLLTGLYLAYFAYALLTMQRQPASSLDADDIAPEPDAATDRGATARGIYWLSLGPALDLERHFVKPEHRQLIAEERWNGWPLLLTSTVVIGASCWLLVHACEALGADRYTLFGTEFRGLGMPTMFVAVIFASMATSVPDLVISIRDARNGAHDDAVANALGSNIFDICFALGFPLLLYTIVHGPLDMSDEVAERSAELRVLLLLLTIVGFAVYLAGRSSRDASGRACVTLGRPQALLLLAIYVFFAAYIVGQTLGSPWALAISDGMQALIGTLPTFG